MISNAISQTSYFGVFLTAFIYCLALFIQKKTKLAILNPLLVTCLAVIATLLATGIDANVFIYGKVKADGGYDGTGAVFFQNMLTPTTVCLAIPLYEKLSYLKKYPLAVFGGILSGTVSCLVSVLAIAVVFGLGHEQYVTLLPKSITTAIGMGLSEELGGIVPVTVAVIVFTGILGNVLAEYIFRLFRIKHPVAQGLACGTGAHAMGTSRAAELGKVQEAMSGLSIAVCGLATVVLASVFSLIY